MNYQSFNPATETLLQTYDFYQSNKVEDQLEKSFQAFVAWRAKPLHERLEYFHILKKVFASNQEILAETISLEMGKVVRDSRREIDRAVDLCDFLIQNAESILSDQKLQEVAGNNLVAFEPYGIVLVVSPWNYPLWSPLRSVLPALAAGNSVIFKPAPNVPTIGLKIVELLKEAGFPDDLFSTLLLSNQDCEKVLSDKRIRMLSFTGSVSTGAHLASIAGKHVTKSVLELGGSDPFLVLRDANIQQAAIDAARSRCANAGQVYCSAKRMIVQQDVYDSFLECFLAEMQAKQPGDPFAEETDYGPLARADLIDKLDTQVQTVIDLGAQVILKPSKMDGIGYYYTTGILSNIEVDNPIYNQEIFGPIASLYKAKDSTDAVRIANSVDYGLSAMVYTADLELANQVSRQIEAGIVCVNKTVGGNPWIPFGGVKNSGYGRENSEFGLREFVSVKSICA